ncbi:hypothetical protein C9374_008295 [Naegleria lovaniensis]|uniref:MYND-type domain-containing protein n=1 Tax=Naegleria lovaniensis TaxID=51637 RepID=A0AA88KHX6_NAELO|nr:uncharacterized protein C9374_008295 [Naegleria lovaniensis]KAG2378656.1 hypothetical protein C9374_008295 [Naegleria lovaniensis]
MFDFGDIPFMSPAGGGLFQSLSCNNPSQPLIFERYDQRLGKLFDFTLPLKTNTSVVDDNEEGGTTTTPNVDDEQNVLGEDTKIGSSSDNNIIGNETPTTTSMNASTTLNSHSQTQIINVYQTLQKCNPSFPQEPCVIPEKCRKEIEKFYSTHDEEDETYLFKLLVDMNLISSGPIVFNIAGNFAGFNGGPHTDLMQEDFKKEYFKTRECYEASRRAHKLYKYDEFDVQDKSNPKCINTSLQKKLIQKAEDALAITEHCIEAYNALALYKATSFEEALELYRQAQSHYKEYYSEKLEKKRKEVLKYNRKGQTWYNHELRQFMRAIIGEANCLRKMGRYKEALDNYQRCLVLDDEIHDTWISWINYMYHIPECLMRLGRWKEAYDFLKKHKSLLNAPPTRTLLWSLALCEYVIKKFTPDTVAMARAEVSGTVNPFKDPIFHASITAPLVYEYLVGVRKLTPVRISKSWRNAPSGFCAPSSQASYVMDHLDLWLAVPGALDWALRNANTVYGFCSITKTEENLERKHFYPNDPYKNFYNFYSRHWFVNVQSQVSREPMLQIAVSINNLQIVQFLVEKGADITTSLVRACEKERDVILQYFCEKVGTLPLDTLFEPFRISVTLGHWKCLKVLFLSVLNASNSVPGLLLNKCMSWLVESKEYDCVNGGPTCPRCLSGRFQHSLSNNYLHCLDLILMMGWKDVSNTAATLESSNKKKLQHRLKQITRGCVALDPRNYGIVDMRSVHLVDNVNRYKEVKPFTEMSSDLMKDIGNDEFQQGNFNDALDWYGRALQKNDNPELKHVLHSNMAQCHINMKQYKLAIEQAQNCIEANPSFVKGYYRKAVALELMGKRQQALDTLEMALKKEPNNDMILKLKQKILKDLEKPSTATSSSSSRRPNSGRASTRGRNPRDLDEEEEDSENDTDHDEDEESDHEENPRGRVCPNCGGERLPYICAQCGKEAKKRCGACHEVRYCSKHCQIKHWPVHKQNCCWVDMHTR